MNNTIKASRHKWQTERGFIAYLVDLDTGNTIARILLREPGCYMASVTSGESSTHETEDDAKRWIAERV